ncbi:autophagy-related protein 9A isoform X2 [Phymastichus coffea]|nr:autophagy-related protein 9A isoform X2 [Phymastichus coffea]
MTTVLDGSYQQLELTVDRDSEDDVHEETPRDSGVIIHVVPEGGKTQWNHIEDLDSFFTRMYHYHQKHGFVCMMLQEGFELAQFVFVVIFTVFLFHGVDYSILFRDKSAGNKTSIIDAIVSSKECLASMGLFTWICILIANIFWLLRLIKVLYHFVQFWDIKCFFNVALKINDSDLDNLTWHEVQKKVIEVQKELQMCIHKRDLTELDIYHRILRFKNYWVAMINKSLLPVPLKIPFIGNIIFMTKGLKYNLELLLFWGPWSPFENSWHIREDYKKIQKRHELARALSKHILWIGIANLVLCPLILLWQILNTFFNYGELLKREPGTLGTRMWSLYGRVYLRHFNELDHELTARLNRAYRPASKYMSMFTSPLLTIFAKNIAFVSGSIFVVFFILTMYDEDFLQVEHVLMILAATGGIAGIARSLIPDENLVWCPESLLTAVLAHTHYRPDSWRGQAHTQMTRAQMAQHFQYRAVHLLEELISPLLTPYILIFKLRYKALDIVDFYRRFTVEVTGVGDICSFAQMDVRKHGNPMWQTLAHSPHVKDTDMTDFGNIGVAPTEKHIPLISDNITQAEDGKTELSLIHFTHTNPDWKPPGYAEVFVAALRERAKKEATNVGYYDTNPLYASLNSLSCLGPEYNGVVSNILRSTITPQMNITSQYYQPMPGMSSDRSITEPISDSISHIDVNRQEAKAMHRGVSRAEGPLHIGERSLLHSLQQATGIINQSLETSILGTATDINAEASVPLELTAIDMSLSTLYLHELHHRQVRRRGYREVTARSIWQRSPLQELEILPELGQERAPLLQHQDSSIRREMDRK